MNLFQTSWAKAQADYELSIVRALVTFRDLGHDYDDAMRATRWLRESLICTPFALADVTPLFLSDCCRGRSLGDGCARISAMLVGCCLLAESPWLVTPEIEQEGLLWLSRQAPPKTGGQR